MKYIISFDSRRDDADNCGNNTWSDPNRSIHVLDAQDSIEFVEVQFQVQCAHKLKAILE